MADDPGFMDRIEDIIARERISVVFVGTDVELEAFSARREHLEEHYGVHVVVSPPRVVEIADDKWRTVQFLRENGFPFPRTARTGNWEEVEDLVAAIGFPLFAKPRRGARSVGVAHIEDEGALMALRGSESELVVQEMLPEERGEFTAGCLVLDGRSASAVVLRRDLRDGNTYRAYSDGATEFDGTVAEIAETLGPHGPCNLQFRVRDGVPVVFEVNARFSGTTPIRAMFGHNEVFHLLNHLLDGVPVPPATIRTGVVLRAWSDILVSPGQVKELAENGELARPSADSHPFLLRAGSAHGSGKADR
jgi:carbamoyl-phosphate synthase large subunit